MSSHALLRTTVSRIALYYGYLHFCPYMTHLAQSVARHVASQMDADVLFEQYLPAATSGYVRRLQENDLMVGMSAQEGWFGFFDADGEAIFWQPTRFAVLQEARANCFEVHPLH